MIVCGLERSRAEVLGAVYSALLAHPDDAWRIRHQWAYALLRDLIAEETEMDGEFVQAVFSLIHQSHPHADA